MDWVTMCIMVELFHACGVLTNDSLDVPLRLGVMRSDLEATIENLELVKPRLSCCYNELHNLSFHLHKTKAIVACAVGNP